MKPTPVNKPAASPRRRLISEDELVEIMARAEKDYKAGKTKILRSLADLM